MDTTRIGVCVSERKRDTKREREREREIERERKKHTFDISTINT